MRKSRVKRRIRSNFFRKKTTTTKRILFILLLLIVFCTLFSYNRQHRKETGEYIISEDDTFLFPAEGIITAIDKEGSHKGNKAVDVSNLQSTPVHASMDGIIAFCGSYGDYGNCVIIEHKDDFSTLYAHLSCVTVQKDDRVEKGDIIGLMGSTGNSTGTHLHFEIRLDEKRENILKYFPYLKENLRLLYD